MKFIKYEENAARREFSDFSFFKRLKFAAGTVLGRLLPSRREKVASAPFDDDIGLLDRFIRLGLYSEAFKQQDHKKLREFFSHLWGQKAAEFHESWNDRFERMFLEHDSIVINDLERLISDAGEEPGFQRLYEIGCGGGQVLQYLHDRFPQFHSLTGVDLGKEQIEKNRVAYSQERLQFFSADACEWIPKSAEPNCVIVTNGGVFEYFLQSELEMLFAYAAKELAPVAICVIETIATDHDLESENDSLVYGRELAFSHNYPHLLKTAGFEIVSCSERPGDSIDGGGRWIRVLAVRR